MEGAAVIGLGDHPALDFLNSIATPARDTIEMLGDGEAYLTWLRLAGLIDARDADEIAATFTPAGLDAAAAEAITLREWLRPIVAAWAGTPDPARAVLPGHAREHLNEILAADHQYPRLEVAGDGTIVLHGRRRWNQARQLLVPPAQAAAQLIAACDPSLVRRCEGPACTLWFYDRTKSHRRRWCSMAVCGNREKARNHRERERGPGARQR